MVYVIPSARFSPPIDASPVAWRVICIISIAWSPHFRRLLPSQGTHDATPGVGFSSEDEGEEPAFQGDRNPGLQGAAALGLLLQSPGKLLPIFTPTDETRCHPTERYPVS